MPDQDGGYYAEILEFPGCRAEGDTPSETYENLDRAAESWIEACFEADQEIPEPFNNLGFSGRIALRLPRSIHRQAARMAERDGVSLNQFLVSAVASRIGIEDCYTILARVLEARLQSLQSSIDVFASNFGAHNPVDFNPIFFALRATTPFVRRMTDLKQTGGLTGAKSNRGTTAVAESGTYLVSR
jgi:predicted RNase H-like HicB family nuclease